MFFLGGGGKLVCLTLPILFIQKIFDTHTLLWIFDIIIMLGNAYHKKSLGKRESIRDLSIELTLHLPVFSSCQSELGLWSNFDWCLNTYLMKIIAPTL